MSEDISRTAEGLRDVLAQIDSGSLESTPDQRAFIAGALYALESLTQK